ncbi:hypothetical protein QN277_010539 [Acacia crassicarpa]|uniref:CCHC-type domain-containing protein n=1 Tax=Acacia crassicarpa TaxID=499986 RepID=A0AAE1JIQ2_9FABA|nr:hypothetical protein QN277_010539 [Acacia crassicarpa]
MMLALSRKSSAQVALSLEENDLLLRSGKKIKNGNGDSVVDEWPKLGTVGDSHWQNGQSFVEKLQGINSGDSNQGSKEGVNVELDDHVSDRDQSEDDVDDSEPLCVINEDPTRNFPTFSFSAKMKKKLYKAWNKAVIVKLLGRSIGYKLLLSILQKLWAKRGVLSLINIGNGFFVVKLTNKVDYDNALTGGPWLIFDHYLTVRPWEPNFHPMKASIDKVAVWVRLPSVFLEYYNKEALTWIGNRLGETIKIDTNTSGHLRGHYIRICVLVDLEKQLMSGFSLEGEDYYLEYEGLHLLCTNCGRYGHRSGECKIGKGKQKAGDLKQGIDDVSLEVGDVGKKGTQSEVAAGVSPLDVWNVVQKHRRPKKTVFKEKDNGLVRQHEGGSRFKALTEVVDTDVGEIRQPALPIMQLNAGDIKEFQSKSTVSGSRMKIGGEKKKNNKKQGMAGGSGVQSQGRQDQRKEKRTRGTEQSEAKSIEGKALSYVNSNGEGGEVSALQIVVHETAGHKDQMDRRLTSINLNSKWHVRNGQTINFFQDNWLLDELKIEDLCKRRLLEVEKKSSVCDWVQDGVWDLRRLADVVQPVVIQRLISTIPPRLDLGYDFMVWGADNNGSFSIKSACFLIENNPHNLRCSLFKHIWRWQGAERIRAFLWLVMLNKLPTNAWRSTWSSASPLCACCQMEVEDLLHILRDCHYAKRLWLKLVEPRFAAQFSSAGLRDWLSMNLIGNE